MEQEIKEPIKRYECLNCKTLINIHLNQDISSHKCCSKPELKLLLFEEGDQIRQSLGNCYEGIQEIISCYMDIPKDQTKIISLWIMGTYFHDIFYTYPYIFINAMRGSGKTRLLKIISHLASKGGGKVHTGANETLLFRSPKHHTLVFDEMESIGSKEKAIMREYFNACYKSGGVVSRAKKVRNKDSEDYVMEEFEPYKPIAMANIWGMDEVLGDRCITFILERSNNPSKTKLLEDFSTNPQINEIKRTLEGLSVVSAVSLRKKTYNKTWNNYILSKYNNTNNTNIYNNTNNITQHNNDNNDNNDNSIRLTELLIDEEFFNLIDESGIEGRNLELMFPLFEIVNWLDKDQFREILDISKEMIKNKKQEDYNETTDILVYQFVSEYANRSFQPLKELTNAFRNFYGADEKEHRWINEKWFGRALRRLVLIKESMRRNAGRIVMLNKEKAENKIKMFGGSDD